MSACPGIYLHSLSQGIEPTPPPSQIIKLGAPRLSAVLRAQDILDRPGDPLRPDPGTNQVGGAGAELQGGESAGDEERDVVSPLWRRCRVSQGRNGEWIG